MTTDYDQSYGSELYAATVHGRLSQPEKLF
jgi:hypothetical protein